MWAWLPGSGTLGTMPAAVVLGSKDRHKETSQDVTGVLLTATDISMAIYGVLISSKSFASYADSGYILKFKLIIFTEVLDMERERKTSQG